MSPATREAFVDLSVNFNNLQEITGGDPAMESELFELFLSSSVDCINGLRDALASGDEKAWRNHAHAFKGISFNLGAAPLGDICKKAQEEFQSSNDAKKTMLADMEAEMENVKKALKERR